MRGNKYQKYLNDDRGSSSINEKLKTGVKTTAKILGAATVIGGGYYGFRQLKESGTADQLVGRASELLSKSRTSDFFNKDKVGSIINKVRVGSEYTGAYLSGLGKTLKSSGFKSILSGSADSELKSNLKEEFTKAATGQARGLGHDKTKFESVLLGLGKTRATHANIAVDNTILDSVLDEVKFQMRNYKGDKDKVSEITSNIARQEFRSHNLRHGLDEDTGHKVIENILKKHKVSAELSAEGIYKVKSNLTKAFTGRGRTKKFLQENRANIKDRYQSIDAEYRKSISLDLRKQSKASKVIEAVTGYKRMTVGEAVKSEIFNSSAPYEQHPLEYLTKEFRSAAAKTSKDISINNPHRIAKGLLKDMPELRDAFVDPMLFVNQSGDMVDMRFAGKAISKTINVLGDSLQVPFINIRPFKMLGDVLGTKSQDLPSTETFLRNTIMPSLEENVRGGLKRDYLFMHGRVIDDTGKLINDDAYLRSSKIGHWQRIASAITGDTKYDGKYHGEQYYPDLHSKPESLVEWLKKDVFSFGYQEYESNLSKKSSLITKYSDPNWERNIWYNLTRGGSDGSVSSPYLYSAFQKMYRTVDNSTQALDSDTLEALKPYLKGTLSEESLDGLTGQNRAKGVMSAIQELLDSEGVDLTYEGQFNHILEDFKLDPSSFDRPIRTLKKKGEYVLPDNLRSMGLNAREILTRMDEAEKILHGELISQIERNETSEIHDLLGDIANAGLSVDQIDSIRKLDVHKELQKIAGKYYAPGYYHKIQDHNLGIFSRVLEEQGTGINETWNDLQSMIFDSHPNMGYGPPEYYRNALKGNEHLLIGKRRKFSHTYKDALTDINEATTLGDKATIAAKGIWSGAIDQLHQLGFGGKNRAGRDNFGEMTSASYLSYYYGFRMNEGLNRVGLGLSSKDIGSAQDLWKNLALKRGLYPAAAVAGIKYLNDELGNVTGQKPSQSVAKGYATVTVGTQTMKELTGVNALGRHLKDVMPGIERIGESPVGRVLHTASFGLIGDTRSPSEMRDYYTRGRDPIRRGRFWSVGSSTPVYGDKISHYEPNWFRRSMGDPMMTDVMYGSTGEYWSNHWLPNPRNPLGMFKPGRRSHWEKKHWDDRPYPVTSTGLEEIPLVGPLLDGTVGRVIKPFRKRRGLQKAHREYLRDINEKTKYYAERSSGPGYIQMTPGGRMTPAQLNINDEQQAQGEAYLSPIGTRTEGIGVPGATVASQDGTLTMVDPSGGFSPVQRGSHISQQNMTESNMAIVNKAYISPIESSSIQSLRDNSFVQNLEEAIDPNSISYRLGRTYNSAAKIGGIYGFAATSQFGKHDPRVTLQSSVKMLGVGRRLDDQNLGGAARGFTNVFRKMMPSGKQSRHEYNPFRNKMPAWMPGAEYFTDFQHGDPYTKVQKGEMRLPGAGYESMNRLHPDIFGEYGAIDRFKILADVAPYSEQYKYYSSVVSRMNENNMISDYDYDDIKQIRQEVSNVKQKYDLHPYKFKYADIIKEKVTVDRWINANTFVTREYPGAPISLAGIKMPSLDDESSDAQTARARLEKTISPGKKIKIGLDADALNRVKDNSMGTMDAVVYDRSGESLNAKLARAKGDAVEADWDSTSATSVRALYTPSAIKFGKRYEKIAHAGTPLNTKFLQIRSPLEMYKRKELYGKSHQSWAHPYRDLIKPMFESHFSQNPLIAAAKGAAFGWLVGRGHIAKKITVSAGALVSGLGASARTVGELSKRTILLDNSSTWIPKRRREQRNIDEYFDMLKYVKYRGLYEKTREVAIREEGTDPETYVNASEDKTSGYLTRKLSESKKWLRIYKDSSYVDKEEIQERLNAVYDVEEDIAQNSLLAPAGALTIQALQYREQYKSTLYGADPYGDLKHIYQGLPKKDRPFFKEFMLAPPEEREEILRLVPDNQKRFYQAKWGIKVDKKPTLAGYFAKHRLPGPKWEGWKESSSIEEIKLKFVKKEGLEVEEFGFWKDDIEYAKNAPTIGNINSGNAIDIIALRRVLEGAGLRDTDIQLNIEYLKQAPESAVDVNVDLLFDRRKEITKSINSNIFNLI